MMAVLWAREFEVQLGLAGEAAGRRQALLLKLTDYSGYSEGSSLFFLSQNALFQFRVVCVADGNEMHGMNP
jgi:hypothetical protein